MTTKQKTPIKRSNNPISNTTVQRAIASCNLLEDMSRHVVEYETLMETSFSDNVGRSVTSRWERKQAQQDKTKGKEQRPRMPLGAQSNGGRASSTSAPSITGSIASSASSSSLQGDRFIPNRGSMNLELSQHLLRTASGSMASANTSRDYADETNLSVEQLTAELDSKAISDATKNQYTTSLSNCMFGVDDIKSSRILSYQDKAPAPKGDTVNNLNILYSASASAAAKKTNVKLVTRSLPTAPCRILDAPDLMDDYYLNLISWSTENILAVALGQTVYLWNSETGDITELCTADGATYISSVSWIQQGGQHLAVGTSCGQTQLWDVDQVKQLRTMSGHSDRVGSLAWNRHILTSASRDTSIINHDVRVAQHAVATLQCHTQEVCGLTWNPDGETLASGGNDNLLCLWDASASASSRSQQPRFQLTDHLAAVKALAWSPHERNLLATGGGTADRTIKFWNSQTGALLNSIETGSQVCSLVWNPYEKEILSSHGFARNQLALWKYPSMAKIKEFEGHSARVLHMAVSSDGGTVVSAAGDETLRFWNVFAAPVKRKTTAADMTFAEVKSKTSWTAQVR
ncbi:hypothetical protein MPSEU_000757000 [Mayamaea pseudoterrestris]|nr:hypothetical protein MPSEU_000757000 [Mayamaea pseudoterrestris]